MFFHVAKYRSKIWLLATVCCIVVVWFLITSSLDGNLDFLSVFVNYEMIFQISQLLLLFSESLTW